MSYPLYDIGICNYIAEVDALCNDVKPWSHEEDTILRKVVKEHGRAWHVVASRLEEIGAERSAAAARNRMLRLEAPEKKGKEGRNFCRLCGQVRRGHTCKMLTTDTSKWVEVEVVEVVEVVEKVADEKQGRGEDVVTAHPIAKKRINKKHIAYNRVHLKLARD